MTESGASRQAIAGHRFPIHKSPDGQHTARIPLEVPMFTQSHRLYIVDACIGFRDTPCLSQPSTDVRCDLNLSHVMAVCQGCFGALSTRP